MILVSVFSSAPIISQCHPFHTDTPLSDSHVKRRDPLAQCAGTLNVLGCRPKPRPHGSRHVSPDKKCANTCMSRSRHDPFNPRQRSGLKGASTHSDCRRFVPPLWRGVHRPGPKCQVHSRFEGSRILPGGGVAPSSSPFLAFLKACFTRLARASRNSSCVGP